MNGAPGQTRKLRGWRVVASILLAGSAAVLASCAAVIWTAFGLVGELRTAPVVLDAGDCPVVVMELASITVSVPEGPVDEFVRLRDGQTTILLGTSARVGTLSDPSVDLLGVDYCRVRSSPGGLLLETITSQGRPFGDPGTRWEPTATGVYAVKPASIDETTVAISADAVGRVEIRGRVSVGDTSGLIFALSACALAALVAAILCVVPTRVPGRHREGSSG